MNAQTAERPNDKPLTDIAFSSFDLHPAMLAGLEAAGCLTRLRGASGGAFRIAPWTVGAAAPPAALLQPIRPASDGTTPAPTSQPAEQAANVSSPGDGIEVTLKADRSPVTEADREAERAIVGVLRARCPDHGVLGEELGEAGLLLPGRHDQKSP